MLPASLEVREDRSIFWCGVHRLPRTRRKSRCLWESLSTTECFHSWSTSGRVSGPCCTFAVALLKERVLGTGVMEVRNLKELGARFAGVAY